MPEICRRSPGNLDFSWFDKRAATPDGGIQMAEQPPYQFMAIATLETGCSMKYSNSQVKLKKNLKSSFNNLNLARTINISSGLIFSPGSSCILQAETIAWLNARPTLRHCRLPGSPAHLPACAHMHPPAPARASPAITAATTAAQRQHGAAHTYLQNNNRRLHNNIHRLRSSGWLRNAEVFGLQPLQVKFYCLYHQFQCIFSSWTCSYDTR